MIGLESLISSLFPQPSKGVSRCQRKVSQDFHSQGSEDGHLAAVGIMRILFRASGSCG